MRPERRPSRAWRALPGRWRRLPRAERWQVLEAALTLAAAALALRLFGLRGSRALLARPRAPARPAALPAAAVEAALTRALARVTRHAPRTPGCLVRALALEALLRRRRLRATLRIGVRRHRGALEAHAWVETAGGLAVDPEPASGAPFSPLRPVPRAAPGARP